MDRLHEHSVTRWRRSPGLGEKPGFRVIDRLLAFLPVSGRASELALLRSPAFSPDPSPNLSRGRSAQTPADDGFHSSRTQTSALCLLGRRGEACEFQLFVSWRFSSNARKHPLGVRNVVPSDGLFCRENTLISLHVYDFHQPSNRHSLRVRQDVVGAIGSQQRKSVLEVPVRFFELCATKSKVSQSEMSQHKILIEIERSLERRQSFCKRALFL